jgi:hypothetical protein
MITVNEAALKDAIDLIGQAIGRPDLNDIINALYGRLDKAEERGETRGYENGYESCKADFEALHDVRLQEPGEGIDPELQAAMDVLSPGWTPAPKAEFPWPTNGDYFTNEPTEDELDREPYEGDSGDEDAEWTDWPEFHDDASEARLNAYIEGADWKNGK